MTASFPEQYREHNRARLEDLQSLGLPLSDARVLELGSGPGDHTGFYVERRCRMTAVDARQECLDMPANRFPYVTSRVPHESERPEHGATPDPIGVCRIQTALGVTDSQPGTSGPAAVT